MCRFFLSLRQLDYSSAEPVSITPSAMSDVRFMNTITDVIGPLSGSLVEEIDEEWEDEVLDIRRGAEEETRTFHLGCVKKCKLVECRA